MKENQNLRQTLKDSIKLIETILKSKKMSIDEEDRANKILKSLKKELVNFSSKMPSFRIPIMMNNSFFEYKYIQLGEAINDENAGEPEQCLNIPDMYGDLIYENDYLKVEDYKFPVQVRKRAINFELYCAPKDGNLGYQCDYIPENCKIVGNVLEGMKNL